MEFPMDILLCVNPSVNHTALREIGYENLFDFIVGNPDPNNSTFHWGDRTSQNPRLKSAKEVVNHVTADYTRYLPINKFVENTTETREPGKLELEKINFLESCHKLNFSDITRYFVSGKKEIFISFNESILEKNISLELKFRGKTIAADRMIEDHRFFSSGDLMEMKKQKMSQYMVKIRENVYVEEDPKKTCRVYPNGKFASYAECDKNFMKEKIEEAAPGLNLTPPWLIQDLDLVTIEPMRVNSDITGCGERKSNLQ